MRYFFNIPSNNNKCNMNCAYCIVKENDEDKNTNRKFSIEQLKTFILNNVDLESDDVLIGFGGSEPLTNSNLNDTIDMLDFIDENNFGISFLTNGIQNTNIIKKYSHLLSKERKKNTPTELEEVSDLIITYHRHELGDKEEYYEKLIKELVELKINVVFQEIAMPCFFDKSVKFLRRMKEKYNVTTKMVTLRAWGKESFSKSFIYELYNKYDMGNTSYTNYVNISNNTCSCFKGFDTFHILNDGNIVKCWYNQTPVGNILDNTLDTNKAIKLDIEIKDHKVIEHPKLIDIDKEKFIENEILDILISENYK